jgi:beta-lactam-binding protein with PASTA domain
LRVLNEKKLRYLITDTFFVDNMPKLAVVEQNPAPNSKVKEGRIIYLSINSDARATVLMPNLINASLVTSKL